MSRRVPVPTRAPEPNRDVNGLPEARDVVLPELVAGLAGAPLEYARWFHQLFFDHAASAVAGQACLVLQDVVIGRPIPLLREVQLWGSAFDSTEIVRMSEDDIAEELGIDPHGPQPIRTEAALFAEAYRSSPCLGDPELECRTIVRLLISTTSTLGSVAPHVRIGGGVVWSYRPSNMLTLLGRTALNRKRDRVSDAPE